MKKRRPKKRPETRGRPEMPEHLRKVNFSCRVPAFIRDGYDRRAEAHGTDARSKRRSSRGLEVERAFLSSQSTPASPRT